VGLWPRHYRRKRDGKPMRDLKKLFDDPRDVEVAARCGRSHGYEKDRCTRSSFWGLKQPCERALVHVSEQARD
jgi:hypothetical protein